MSPTHALPQRARARLLITFAVVTGLLAAILVPGTTQRAEAAAGDIVIPPGSLAVTFVARACPEYTDIMANRARNNIQESLRDLGEDTVYRAGEPISPAIEDPNQPACAPLRDWDFQLGRGITGKTPETQYLSTVTGAFDTSITTGGPVAEIDQDGVDTGRTIDGAVTVVLDADETALVQSGQQLWTQGGVGGNTLPLPNFGFGALRCAVDNLNGDNVEFISYPQAARHVFCYYYTVATPPPPGTITVVKQLAPGNIGSQEFRFEGNISYDPAPGGQTGEFFLTAAADAPAQTTFIRGAILDGVSPWTFGEIIPSGWQYANQPSCTSQLGSAAPYDPVTGLISVTLLPGDDVVCTFTNTRRTIGPSALYKETLGGTGTFPFRVVPPPPASPITPTVTTSEPETATLVATPQFNLPGTYTATETLPTLSYGSWELQEVVCNIGGVTSLRPIVVNGQDRTASADVGIDQSANCVFINEFTSDGAIRIQKTTEGGVGTFEYGIVRADSDSDSDQYAYEATTQAPGLAAQASPVDGSETATNLPIGSQWEVQELLPAATADGFWRVVSADCGPAPVPRDLDLDTATLTVQITEQNPVVQCAFTNEFVSEGSLEVVKTTSPDTALRPDSALLVVVCDDSSEAGLGVPPGAERASTGVIPTTGFRTCFLREPLSGAAPGVTVETAATITVNGVASPYALDAEFVIEPEDRVLVEISNVLTPPAPPPPTPTPTATPTHPPLPATGSDFDAAPLVAISVAVIAAGLVLMLGARVRRRS